MNRIGNRGRKIVAAHGLALGLLSLGFTWNRLEATPSDAATLDTARLEAARVEAPAAAPADQELLAELTDWVAPAAEPADVVDAIKAHPVSFEVFTGYHGDDERNAVLTDVPFGDQIAKAAGKHDVDSLLVAAVVEVESTFKPSAGSNKGAIGLMQILPSTAGKSAATLRNPTVNLDAGTEYLRYLIDRFEGDLELALAAYNAGPTNVLRYKGVPPFTETQNYVQKVLGIYVDHHRATWKKAQTADALLQQARQA